MGCCFSEYTTPKVVAPKHNERVVSALPSMKGKVVAITGTTSGTGFCLAQALGKLGASTVILLNRKSERSVASLAKLQTASPGTTFTALECDLMNFASVRQAIAQVKAQHSSEGVDVLVCNAGVMALADERTGDGFDLQIQTNHLSHFLLVAELFPLLETAAARTGEARVVSHSSVAAYNTGGLDAKFFAKCERQTLGGDSASMSKGRWKRYGQSKLANQVFTSALAAKLSSSESKVKALVAHPGYSATGLQVTTYKDGGMSKGMIGMTSGQMQAPADGALGIIVCACRAGVKNGEYFAPGAGVGMKALKGEPKSLPLHKDFTVPEAQQALWDASEAAIGSEFSIR
jgi:NAD(P)-dependent dehydrogenase (short-subunit alcohol dehydrogenase family)